MGKASVILLYIRLSVEDADAHESGKDESDSVSNQRGMLRTFVAGQPEFAGCQVIELCDDGYSGTNMNRPAVARLLEMARTGQADCIIVKDFSRFGRDYLTVSDYVDQIFPFMGIRFISINDHYDSAKCNGATSGLDIAFCNVIYGYYSQDLSIKVKSGKRTKAENGDFLSPFAPIGYQKSPENKNRLVIEPAGAEIVRRIFQMAGAGTPVLGIARQLNAEGVITPGKLKNQLGLHHKWWEGVGNDGRWSTNAVTRILRDERYLGRSVYGKRSRIAVGGRQTRVESKSGWVIVEGCHEPIITLEEFAAARANLKKYVEKGKAPIAKHLFSGKLRCGNCGYALERRTKPIPQFCCVTYRMMKDCGCGKGHVKESELAETVLAAVRTYADALLDEKALLKKAESTGCLAQLQKQAAVSKRNAAGLKEQKARLYDMLAEQEITRETFRKRQDLLSMRQKESEQQQENAQAELSRLERILYSGQLKERKLRDYGNMTELTREIVEALIDCIYVFDSSSIHIQWRFEEEAKA